MTALNSRFRLAPYNERLSATWHRLKGTTRAGRATRWLLIGDGHANLYSGLMQPGFRPQPKIVYIGGLNGPDRPPNFSKKVEGEALHLFGRGLEADRARLDPKYKQFSAPAETLVADGQNLG